MFLLFFFIICFIVFLVAVYVHNGNVLLRNFYKSRSVLCFGVKGSGKDIIMQHACRLIGRPHYGTVSYSRLTTVKPLTFFSVKGLSFENFIEGNIIPGDRHYSENYDFYASDLGVYLPCQYDKLLDEKYKSLPVAIALSRQLWNANFHANSQALSRSWIKIREQFGGYIRCLSTKVIGRIAFTRCIFYDKYESAEQALLPMRQPFLCGKETKALARQFEATNGMVKSRVIVQILPKSGSCYDTRYFHRLVYGCPAPKEAVVPRQVMRRWKHEQKLPFATSAGATAGSEGSGEGTANGA